MIDKSNRYSAIMHSNIKAYSADLRQKIVAAYENGAGTPDEIADLFSIARRSVDSYLKLHRTGASLQPKPHGGGVAFSLTEKHLTVLQERIAEKNDLTLDELVAYLKGKENITVHRSTVCRALQRLGLPRKKRVWRRRNETKRRGSCFAGMCRGWRASALSSLMNPAFIRQ
jgi:transposase